MVNTNFRIIIRSGTFACVLLLAMNLVFADSVQQSVARVDRRTTQCVEKSALTLKQLAAKGFVVDNIEVQINPIFDLNDPEENIALYRWVNSFHIMTNKDVIEKDILFKSGEVLDLAKISETERLLRTRPYIWDATIDVESVCKNKVNLKLTTRDVWTLQPSINFGRSGGENKLSFDITDTNLFGTGKVVEVSRFSDVDRTGYSFGYQDHDFLKNRWRLNVNYADLSDGYTQFFQLKRPFYALDTRWEAGGNVFNNKFDNFLYFRGQITDQFTHRVKGGNIFAGNSDGYINNEVSRIRYGYNYTEELFSTAQGIYDNSALPEDRTFSYPWISYEYIQDKFEELKNVKQIGRTEDVNLGWHFSALVGYSMTTLGADKNRLVLNSSLSKFSVDSFDNLWNWNINFRTNIANSAIENGLIRTSLKFYSRQNDWHSFYVNIEGAMSENLYRDQQLTLGGDNGLRGYPLRYQIGNRRFLLTLEERFYTHWEVFKLFNVGAAIFADTGRAWFSNQNNGLVDKGLLKDMGIGLRLSSTRSGHNQVVHIDLAKPIGADGDVKGLQWLVSLQTEF